jgi:nicotinamidase/pyrazinamidase
MLQGPRAEPHVTREDDPLLGETLTLLLIDPQNDFHPGGTLAIESADADAARIASFIDGNLGRIERIVVTLDSHRPNHIAHAACWTGPRGDAPPPFTTITRDDVTSGRWRPSRANWSEHADAEAALEWAGSYTASLERAGETLTVWPPHCIDGSDGHAVRAVIQRSLDRWAGATGRAVRYVRKGECNHTEMYSALRALVPKRDDARTHFNVALHRELTAALGRTRRLVVCGQALSHCVRHTVGDLVEPPQAPEYYAPGRAAVRALNGEQRRAITLLLDGSSCVAGSEHLGETFVGRMRALGVRTALIGATSASTEHAVADGPRAP